MTPGRDAASGDDALSWDGHDDPTLDVGVPARAVDRTGTPGSAAPAAHDPAEPKALPDGYTAVGRGSGEVGRIVSDGTVPAPEDRAGMGNATLIALGVLGGIHLLYAIGWLIGAGRLSLVATLFLDPLAFQVTLWLAVLAPPIWFVTVLLLTRGSRTWIRFAMLTIGAAVLVPWPFVLAGAAL